MGTERVNHFTQVKKINKRKKKHKKSKLIERWHQTENKSKDGKKKFVDECSCKNANEWPYMVEQCM